MYPMMRIWNNCIMYPVMRLNLANVAQHFYRLELEL